MPNIKAAPARAARLQAESKPVNRPPTANRITRAARTANTIAKLEAEILALENGLAGWKRKAKDGERLQGLLAASRSLADQTAAKLARAEAGAAELAGALRQAVCARDAVTDYLQERRDAALSVANILQTENGELRRKLSKSQYRRALELVGATLAGAAAAVLAYHFPLSAVLS